MRLMRSRRGRARVAVVVLVPFVWLASNVSALAEIRCAQRDPVRYFAQRKALVDSALSPAARKELHSLIDGFGAAPVSAAVAPPAAALDAEQQVVAEMQSVAEMLDALQASGSGARLATIADASSRRPTIAAVMRRLVRLHRQVLAVFSARAAQFGAAPLSAQIWARQSAARRNYAVAMRSLRTNLKTVWKGTDPSAVRGAIAAAVQLLRSTTDSRPSQPLDLQRLPFRSPESVTRAPRSSNTEFGAHLARPTLATPAPPTADDLAPNEDVQLTPAIQTLAASLHNQPLQIFDWVRNNIEFVPTYGAVQGSQMTLDAKRGNAFDTATLLIALLRASGIPSRYVAGTVEIPTDQVLNWVGGAETPGVAQQLLGQGGIANLALVSNGSVVAIRLEHVWVEAWIDFVPSRGAVHRQGDTWIPMDASLKFHTLTPPSGLQTAVPFGPANVPTNLFTVDETLGRMTNVNLDPLEDPIRTYITQAEQYTLANHIAPTADALFGGQTIMQQTSEAFAGSLPYNVVARGAPQATLPPELRHYVTLNGYESSFDRSIGTPAFSFRIGLPALNSRRLGVEFDPATAADAAVLEQARTNGAASLPVALVNVTPAVKVDGAVQTTGGAVGMGTGYFFDVVLEDPNGATTVPYDEIAGDEIVFGVTGNGVSPAVVEQRFATHPVDNAGEYFQQVQLQYWAQSDSLAAVSAKGLHVLIQRLPSVGLFGSPLTVTYFFGFPQSGVYQSRFMDVRQSLLAAAGADLRNVIFFRKQAGRLGSFIEGATFDKLQPGEDPGVRGVSSMVLLSAAASIGIPIYRITSTNLSAVLPLLSLNAAVENDIVAAVNAGKTVIVPQSNVSQGPWSGVGYIVENEGTGAAAYLISGGISGGGIADCLRELVPKFLLLLAIALLALAVLILLIILLGEFAPILVPALAAAPAVAPAGPAPPTQPAAMEATNAEHFRYLMLFLRSMAVFSEG